MSSPIDNPTHDPVLDEARKILDRLEEKGYVLMPKHATEEIIWAIIDHRNGNMGPYRFYKTIIEAGHK